MNIVAAQRVSYLEVPRPISAAAKAGLRYERAVRRALAASSHCIAIYNPQFKYEINGRMSATGSIVGHCIPDFILSNLAWLSPSAIVVLECKLTWKPEAAQKLLDFYCPVVGRAQATELVFPVVIAKNLTREAPEPHLSLKTAIFGRLVPCAKTPGIPSPRPPSSASSVPVVHWLGRGEFPIG